MLIGIILKSEICSFLRIVMDFSIRLCCQSLQVYTIILQEKYIQGAGGHCSFASTKNSKGFQSMSFMVYNYKYRLLVGISHCWHCICILHVILFLGSRGHVSTCQLKMESADFMQVCIVIIIHVKEYVLVLYWTNLQLEQW